MKPTAYAYAAALCALATGLAAAASIPSSSSSSSSSSPPPQQLQGRSITSSWIWQHFLDRARNDCEDTECTEYSCGDDCGECDMSSSESNLWRCKRKRDD